jgi:hypothetical protein
MQMVVAIACAALLMIASFFLRGVSEGTDGLAPAVYALPVLAIALALWPLIRNRLPGRTSAK